MGLSRLGASAAASRFITKQNTAGAGLLGTVFVSSTGTWFEVTSSLSVDTVVTQIALGSDVSRITSWSMIVVEIARGASGSETTIALAHLQPTGALGSNSMSAVAAVAPGERVSAGQRIAVRIYSGPIDFNGGSVAIGLAGVPYANIEGN